MILEATFGLKPTVNLPNRLQNFADAEFLALLSVAPDASRRLFPWFVTA